MPDLLSLAPSKLCICTVTVTLVPGLSFALHDLISSIQPEADMGNIDKNLTEDEADHQQRNNPQTGDTWE